MTIAYFDCVGGVSGDMILGALVDAGLSVEQLTEGLSALGLKGYRLEARRVRRGSLMGTQVQVITEKNSHPERSFPEIQALLQRAQLSPGVCQRATEIFRRLAQAEAKVHGVVLGEVRFHEVGALDAIIDVVGALVGLEALGIRAVYASPLPTGRGAVSSAHGTLPVPAPAVLELAAMAHAPLCPGPDGTGERTTPTGAAILATVARFRQPTLVLEKVGYGAGSCDPPGVPNLLRLWLGEALDDQSEESLLLFETNIDDMNPELYGYLLERLLASGARDVWFTPIQMKKNRPGTMVSVLAPASLEGIILQQLFEETSTLGIRMQPVHRHEVAREVLEFISSLGPAAAKIKRLEGAVAGVAPEFDRCRDLARQHGLPLQEVYRIVQEEAWQSLASKEKSPLQGKGEW